MPTRSLGWWVAVAVAAVVVIGGFLVGLWALLHLGSIGRDATAPFARLADNGAYYTSSDDRGRVTILRHPIDATGAFGEPTQVFEGAGASRGGPAVVDGRSPWVLVGWSDETGVTERVEVRTADNGEVLGALAADSWCGGEGPDGFACTLLDDRRLARTTVLAPGYYAPVSILVSSLETGSTLAEHGPFPGLQAMLGTESPDHLVLRVADAPTGATGEGSVGDAAGDDPIAGATGAGPTAAPPTGEMLDLDLTTGRTTLIGRYDVGWAPLCVTGVQWQADGSPDLMSVAGIQRTGEGPAEQLALSGVGPAPVAAVTWPAGSGFEPAGCSADGRFAYLMLPESDSERVTRVVVDRIDVRTGGRSTVLDSAPPIPGPWTR